MTGVPVSGQRRQQIALVLPSRHSFSLPMRLKGGSYLSVVPEIPEGKLSLGCLGLK